MVNPQLMVKRGVAYRALPSLQLPTPRLGSGLVHLLCDMGCPFVCRHGFKHHKHGSSSWLHDTKSVHAGLGFELLQWLGYSLQPLVISPN